MSKAAAFKRRLAQQGETITLTPWVSHAEGDCVADYWDAPDPESADYPTEGDPPGGVYGAAVNATAIVQPLRGKDAEQMVHTPWGEHVRARVVAYIAGDTTVGFRDKVDWNDITYWVAGMETWKDGGEVVFYKVFLAEAVE